MDLPSYYYTEIDTTPFKTLDHLSTNSSRKYKNSHGIIPKYIYPKYHKDFGQSREPVQSNLSPFDRSLESGYSDIIDFDQSRDSPHSDVIASTFDHPQVIFQPSDEVNGGSPWNTGNDALWNNVKEHWNNAKEHLWSLSNDSTLNLSTWLDLNHQSERSGNQSSLWSNLTGKDGLGEDAMVVEATPDGGEWGPGLLVVTGLALYTLALCTAVGNALVIHAIRTEKRLQTVSNLFIMSLAAADLTVGVIVMPISAAYAMTGEWRLGIVVCQFWLAADYTASTASIFNLVILSLDRYWSITAPLRYLRRRTRRRAWVMIGASWAAAGMWLVPVLAWHHLTFGGIRQHPPHVCETEFSNSAAFKAVTAALNFYLPTALMLYLYCRIFREVQTRQVLGRVSFANHQEPNTDSCSEMDRHSRQPSRNAQTPSLSHARIPNASERSQFHSLTLVSPGKHDCSHYSGVMVSVEYLPDDDDEISPTLHHHYYHQQQQQQPQHQPPQQQPQQQPQQHRRQGTANRLGPHHNHIHCYQSSSRPNPSWDPSSPNRHISHRPRTERQKWSSNWRIRSNSRLESGTNQQRDESLQTSSNGTKKANSVASSNNSSGGVGGRRMEGVNLAKERKAARQLGVIVGAFMACWVPYFTLFPIMALCDTCVPAHAHTATIWLGYLNSTLNPVLYPLCNHNFRRAFARMLHLPTRKTNNYAHTHRIATIAIRH